MTFILLTNILYFLLGLICGFAVRDAEDFVRDILKKRKFAK